MTDQAVLELGNITSLPVSKKKSVPFFAVVYAAEASNEFDQVAWAEKLTKQYDDLKGAKRYNQLASQLGVDAKTAFEQMTIAQKIVHKGAMDDAEWNNKVVNILQATKTTCKVSILGLSLVATGGSSVTALEGAGFIVSGIEYAIEVADTALSYNENTNEVAFLSDSINLEMQFFVGPDGVTGTGHLYGTLWDEPLDASIEMVKQ